MSVDVSLLVPAYNEEEIVEDTLDSMEKCGEYIDEAWLLDDGSEDGTSEEAREYIEENGLNVSIYRNEKNGGKVGAIENALEEVVETDFSFCMDADSWIEDPERIEEALEYMEEEDLSALGFRVEPKVDSDSLYGRTLQECQSAGYAFGRLLHRFTSWNYGREESQLRHFAGAGYMADTEKLEEALEMHSREFDGEDMQTAALMQLEMGERVEYFPDLTVKTEVPEDMRELFRQRTSWNHGAAHTYAELAENYMGEAKNIDRPLTHYSLYETVFLTGVAPVLAAGVAGEAVEGNLEPAFGWYMLDTAVTAAGLEMAYQKDELEDRSYMKYLPFMSPYRAAAFFPGKLASYPEFLKSTGEDVTEQLLESLRDKEELSEQKSSMEDKSH